MLCLSSACVKDVASPAVSRPSSSTVSLYIADSQKKPNREKSAANLKKPSNRLVSTSTIIIIISSCLLSDVGSLRVPCRHLPIDKNPFAGEKSTILNALHRVLAEPATLFRPPLPTASKTSLPSSYLVIPPCCLLSCPTPFQFGQILGGVVRHLAQPP